MLEPTPNNPIVNDGLLYVNGLQIINTGNAVKTLFLTQGAARDSKNINDITLPSSITINGSLVGSNGVDLASLIPNTIYAIYVIADSTSKQQTAGLFSLSSSSPFLPFGYDMFRRVGWILTDGSANIMNFVQSGINESRTYYYESAQTVLVEGTANVYTLIDLSSVLPPVTQTAFSTINEVYLNLLYTQSSPTHFVQFHYDVLSGSPMGIVLFGAGATTTIPGSVVVPSRSQKIAYRIGAGDTLINVSLTGYTDYLY
jgi:hypothetical protein